MISVFSKTIGFQVNSSADCMALVSAYISKGLFDTTRSEETMNPDKVHSELKSSSADFASKSVSQRGSQPQASAVGTSNRFDKPVPMNPFDDYTPINPFGEDF